MSTKLSFVTVDVFTQDSYTGNPLAVVTLPKDTDLSQDEKQKIAREFNLSETVFLHEDNSSAEGRQLDIFTATDELPFAGHPTIGALCYIGSHLPSPTKSNVQAQHPPDPLQKLQLRVKAGIIKASYNTTTSLATAEIPHNVHDHGTVPDAVILKSQPSLSRANTDEKASVLPQPVALVSIVNGMTFALVRLASESVLGKLSTTAVSIESSCKDLLHEGWSPSFIAPYYHVVDYDTLARVYKVKARMIDPAFGEDPATGSAACCLAAHLTLREGGPEGEYRFEIVQGEDMGRRSEIGVRVRLDGTGKGVEKVVLEGSSVEVMEGSVRI